MVTTRRTHSEGRAIRGFRLFSEKRDRFAPLPRQVILSAYSGQLRCNCWGDRKPWARTRCTLGQIIRPGQEYLSWQLLRNCWRQEYGRQLHSNCWRRETRIWEGYAI